MALDIRPYNSAPSQQQSAFSVRWAMPILHKEGVQDVAEYGCGRLRNVSLLKQLFDRIDLVELEQQIYRIKGLLKPSNQIHLLESENFLKSSRKYDAIFLISVLHTMPMKKERVRIIERCISKLHVGGFLIVDVPQSETYYNRRKNSSRKYKDGWLMQRGTTYTFYKNYFSEELDNLVKTGGPMHLFRKVRYCKHLIRIWQKA